MKVGVGVVVLALVPQAASAHGSLAGGGGFYAGIAHPFLAWEHTIVLIGLGLLIGSLGRLNGRIPLLCLLIGLCAGLASEPILQLAWSGTFVLVLAVTAGIALVVGKPLPLALTAILALITGAAVALDTGVPPPPNMTAVEVYAPYFGVTVGVFLIVLNAMAVATWATHPPFTIGVRMVGSWIAAIALMLLALHLRQSSVTM